MKPKNQNKASNQQKKPQQGRDKAFSPLTQVNTISSIPLVVITVAKILEIIGWLTIRVPLFVFRIVRFILFSTIDAFFFMTYLGTKALQRFGRYSIRLPFILGSLCVMTLYNTYRSIKMVLSWFSPLLSTMLGVPTLSSAYVEWIVTVENRQPASRPDFLATTLSLPLGLVWRVWRRFAFPSRAIFFLRRSLHSFVHEVNAYQLYRREHSLGFAVSGGTLLALPAMLILTYVTILKDLPMPSKLRTQKQPLTTRIYDRNNILLYKIYRSANRTELPLSDIPLSVRQATIAIEDHGFYQHRGISLRGIIRAALANYTNTGGGFSQGGSTITQQLIKNTLLTPERTVERKLKEIFLSLVAEAIYSKDEILEMYLNTVPYGGTAYGIEEASQTYFRKSARELTLAEAALLAGLPTAPTTYSPHGNHPELSKIRQKEVFRNMVELGLLSEAEAKQAVAQELAIAPPTIAIQAPHFVMYVKDYLTERLGRKMVEEGGLTVQTTLDLSLQEKVEAVVAKENQELRGRFRANNAAALVTNPGTGEILAMVGSANYWDQGIKGNVNVTTSLRQPGSAIKVVNYAYALSHGFTPSTIILDSPVVYQIPGSVPYAPVNYDGSFHGPVTLRNALARSYNVPAVKVLATYGPQKMVEMGKRMGITTWDNLKHYGLSLTLGAGDVKMVDMAVVYGTVANMGVRKDLTPISQVSDAFGRRLKDSSAVLGQGVVANAQSPEDQPTPTGNAGAGEAVISPSVAYWLIDILSDNQARLAAFGRFAKLEIPGHRVAVKTGTTNEFRDNWTIGFTPKYLVATWVGNTDNSSMNRSLVSGITGAAPIWNAIMTDVLAAEPADPFTPPTGLKPVKICATTGTLACTYCKEVVTEYYLPGTEPKATCNIVSPDECADKKSKAESEGKKADEIAKILGGCSLPTPQPNR